MDPNETLKEIQKLAETADPSDMDRICELFQSLDAWIAKGGFLPAEWAFDKE